jgi:hypothetical protein
VGADVLSPLICVLPTAPVFHSWFCPLPSVMTEAAPVLMSTASWMRLLGWVVVRVGLQAVTLETLATVLAPIGVSWLTPV